MQVPIVLCRKNTNIVIPPRQTVKTQGGKQLGYFKKKNEKMAVVASWPYN